MSFATLPPTIHDNIVSHLVRRRIRGKPRPIAVGKAYSLVCRNSRFAGQKIIWRIVNVEYAQLARPPFVNFQQRRHLHLWIRCLFIANDVNTCSAASIASVLVITRLLQYCRYLEIFFVDLPARHPSTLIHELLGIASRSDHLRMLSIPNAPTTIDHAAIEILRKGFPLLDSLALTITVPPSEFDAGDYKALAKYSSRAGVMQRFKLVGCTPMDPEQIPHLLTMLAGTLRLSDSSECDFGGSLFHWTTMSWLAFQSVQVREVIFVYELPDLKTRFLDLLRWMPKLDRVISLLLNPKLSMQKQLKLDLESPVSITHFLSVVPFSLHLVSIRGVSFTGGISYVETRQKMSALALIEGPLVQFFLKTSDSQTFVNLKKMKDKKGIWRWHRVIDT